MARTNILKCVQVLPMRSGANQRAHGPILSRIAINQEEDSPNQRHEKGNLQGCTIRRGDGVYSTSHQKKELHIWDQSIIKLYTDDCGRFPIRSRSDNEYIMIAYYCDSNTILQAPFADRKNNHRIRAYNSLMTRLDNRGHQVDVQILDNEFSAEFKISIVDDWGATYQLVPPNIHRINIAERAIRTLKAHFLSVLGGVDPAFPKLMWDNLFDQTELTLNPFCQATLNPHILAW